MTIRNRVWEELYWSKLCILCILRYTARHRRYNRWYATFIAFTASIGAFGYLKFHIAPLISTVLIGVVSLAKAIFPSLLQKEEELSSLDVITDFYVEYMTQLEHLFYKFQNNLFDKTDELNDNIAAEEFFKLKEKECDKQSLMNKLLRKIRKKEHECLNKEATEYVNRVYFNKYEESEQ